MAWIPSAPSHAAESPLSPSAWRTVAIALALLLLPLLLWMSLDFGVTLDEGRRQANGERIWRLYRGDIVPPVTANENLHGGLFDVLAVGLQQILPLEPYNVRHLLNAVFGWIGIACCGMVVARLAGWRAAAISLVLLAGLPPYVGHAMNNPKDAPFAALATAALLVIASLPRQFPYLPLRHAVVLGVTIGLCVGVRPGGLLFAGYGALWILAAIVMNRDLDLRHLAQTAGTFAIVIVLVLLVPLPVWPYLWERPITGVFEASEGVAHYAWIGPVLFQGRDIGSVELPWTYAPVWLVLTTPLVVWAGAVVSLAGLRHRGIRRAGVIGLWFAVLFPIAYVIVRHSVLYDGIRHLLFVLPPLVALAAIGWDDALRATRSTARGAVAVLLALGLAEPILFQLRNHPNQVVYFQPLAGGPAAMVGRFDMDYWGNCLFEAMHDADAVGHAIGRPVTISGRQYDLLQRNAPRVRAVAVSRPSQAIHELELYMLRGRRKDLAAFAARSDILWQVATADGAPLCAVVSGPQYSQLRRSLELHGIARLPL
jgi:hypothetical protein